MQNAIHKVLDELCDMSSIPFMGIDEAMEKEYNQKLTLVEILQNQLTAYRNRHLHLIMLRDK
jgi:hypothetical protein